MKIIKKISIKNVCGDPFEIMGTLKSTLLMSIIGEVTEIETFKSDQYKNSSTGEPSESFRLKGQFRAKNNTGETFTAAECFLPAVAANMIQQSFEIGKRNGFNYLQFGLNIGCNYNAKVACRYEYFAESLLPPDAASTPFAAIENKIKEASAALPAPKSTDTVSNSGKNILPLDVQNPGGITDPKDIAWEE
jgi:hypothetical protein